MLMALKKESLRSYDDKKGNALYYIKDLIIKYTITFYQ